MGKWVAFLVTTTTDWILNIDWFMGFGTGKG
jgi:hypothetical protein